MATTFVKIATVTVGAGGASTMDFNSIPSTYTDLLLKTSLRLTNSSTYTVAVMSINGVTTNRTLKALEGGDGTASSYSLTDGRAVIANAATSTASTFSSGDIYIPNYAGSANKSWSSDSVNEGNAANGYYQELYAGLWSSTAAITSLSLSNAVGTFVQYSSATLYGISKS